MRHCGKWDACERHGVWSFMIESTSPFWIALVFLLVVLGVNGYITTAEATAPAKIFPADPESILFTGDVDHNRDAVLASFVDCRDIKKRFGFRDCRLTTPRD